MFLSLISLCLSWLSVMSLAASDDDGSDEKQSLVRRRTITGGLILNTHLAFILCLRYGLLRRQRTVWDSSNFSRWRGLRLWDLSPCSPVSGERENQTEEIHKIFQGSPRGNLHSPWVSESSLYYLISCCYCFPQGSPVLWWGISFSRDISTLPTTILGSILTCSVTWPRYQPEEH